jgi:dihydrofolate reductase
MTRLAGGCKPGYNSGLNIDRPMQPNSDFEIVVAVARNDAIGRANALPWHIRSDLQHFKSLTLDKTVLMGRKTHESIGEALPKRRNVVLTRDAQFSAPGCVVAASLQQALNAAAGEPVMVIGGAEIFRLCLGGTRRIHLTLVHTEVCDADAFFAEWRRPEWIQSARSEYTAGPHDDYDFSFVTLDRAQTAAR